MDLFMFWSRNVYGVWIVYKINDLSLRIYEGYVIFY